MLNLVGNPEDSFPQEEAHTIPDINQLFTTTADNLSIIDEELNICESLLPILISLVSVSLIKLDYRIVNQLY